MQDGTNGFYNGKFYTEYIDNFLFMGIETKNMTGGILIPISTENKMWK